MDVYQSTVSEVSLSPYFVEQYFEAKHATWIIGKFAQQSELSFRQFYFVVIE
jgi:hypothetical protein